MDAKAPRGPFGSSPSMDDGNRPPSPLKLVPSNGQPHGPKSTTSSIKAWRPSLPDLHGSEGLTIPYSGQQSPSREQYEQSLEQRLKELIDQNPSQAQQLLSSSPEHLPDLYEIAMQ